MAIPKRGQQWKSNATEMILVILEYGPLKTKVGVGRHPDGTVPPGIVKFPMDTEILLSGFHFHLPAGEEMPEAAVSTCP